MKKTVYYLTLLIGSLSTSANAVIISEIGSDWNIMDSDDQTSYFLNPGYGGQNFDAEYLLYKYDETTSLLTIALQTGFDVTGDNHQVYSNESYWGGDFFLSFDGDNSTFEYALDFGQTTGTWNDRSNLDNESGSIGAVASGLYQVTSENNQTYYNSDPFAMASGNLVSSDVSFSDYSGYNAEGYGGNNTSYAKIASFNLDVLGYDITQMDAHWTMSCGNDVVVGAAELPPVSVPEPTSLALLSTGLIGLIGGLIARRRKQTA